MLRGGGKYSSSSVMLTISMPSVGSRNSTTAATSSSGADAPGGHADHAGEVVRQFVDVVDAEDTGASRADGELFERQRVRRVARTEHDDHVAPVGHGHQRALAIRRGETQVAAARGPHVGEPLLDGHGDAFPVAVRQRRLGEQGDRTLDVGQLLDLLDRLDPIDRVGRHRHRADRLLVAFVADVDDAVALPGAHLHLVVDLGDQRAHRVDDVRTTSTGGFDDSGRRPVRRQHDRHADRHVADVVDEHHPEPLEALDDESVVDDLVVAVHGSRERPDHPGQRLDRHLDAGTEPSRFGEQHRPHGRWLFDAHYTSNLSRQNPASGGPR